MTNASQPKVLFATSEAHPLMKTGGLADVSGALPAALHTQGLDTYKLLLPGTTLPLLNVTCDAFFNREGGSYQTPSGSNWQPGLVRCNDWRTGLAPAYLRFWIGQKAASIMTIHNGTDSGVSLYDMHFHKCIAALRHAVQL